MVSFACAPWATFLRPLYEPFYNYAKNVVYNCVCLKHLWWEYSYCWECLSHPRFFSISIYQELLISALPFQSLWHQGPLPILNYFLLSVLFLDTVFKPLSFSQVTEYSESYTHLGCMYSYMRVIYLCVFKAYPSSLNYPKLKSSSHTARGFGNPGEVCLWASTKDRAIQLLQFIPHASTWLCLNVGKWYKVTWGRNLNHSLLS